LFLALHFGHGGPEVAMERLCRKTEVGALAGDDEEVRRVGKDIRPQGLHLAGGDPALRIGGRQEAAKPAGEDEKCRGLHAVDGRMMRGVPEKALVEIEQIAPADQARGGNVFDRRLAARLIEQRMLAAAIEVIDLAKKLLVAQTGEPL